MTGTTAGADLALGPATRLLWRGPDAVHLELGSRAVVVEGLPVPVLQQLASPLRPDAGPRPVSEPVAHALATLAEAGYLWARAAEPDDTRLAVPHPQFAGELAALAVRHGARAAEVLSTRRHAIVEIRGTSRVAAQFGAVLAAAGVGRVCCRVEGSAKLARTCPGGITPADEGGGLSAAVEAAVRRAAPSADTAPLPPDERADLTVFALDGPLPDERVPPLHARNAPYLMVTLGVDFGVVGPLVLPGLTSCVRCADLHRRDRDPAWSALAVQLTVERRYGPASPVATATMISGLAAQQALAFLDGDEPDCLDATLELRLPDYRIRRRSWPPHPQCGCTDASPETDVGHNGQRD